MKTKGFTLVEVLIVIAIVAMLSTIAVNGYVSYRRATLIEYSADNFISQITELSAKANYGEVSGERIEVLMEAEGGVVEAVGTQSFCYGVKYSEGVIKKYVVPFNNKKVWNGSGWEFSGCEEASEFSGFEWDQEVEVLAEEDFYLEAVPPDGHFESDKQEIEVELTLNGESKKILIIPNENKIEEVVEE